jgi:hypothetical protein
MIVMHLIFLRLTRSTSTCRYTDEYPEYYVLKNLLYQYTNRLNLPWAAFGSQVYL